MRQLVFPLTLVFLLGACDAQHQGPVAAQPVPALNDALERELDKAAELDRAGAAIQAFASELKAALSAAMQAGGPVSAIEVCNTRAMSITARVARQQGLQLARVSLKSRNPANAPSDWQAAILEEFEQRKADGEDPAGMAWSEYAGTGGLVEFRMMRAIPTTGVCLVCHGTDISPDVAGVLGELYPQDTATGFSEGDIRGAFVVTRKIRPR